MSRALVAVTAIPRAVHDSLPVAVPSATSYDGFGRLVAEAGAIPVYVDPFADPIALVGRVDAVILSGGGDIRPDHYDATAHPATHWLDERRDAFELALLDAALERRLPVIGVCRGMQLLNVVLGGTLVQHLPDVGADGHSDYRRFDLPVHDIAFEPGSRMGALLPTVKAVNTLHHQAIGRLGRGLRVAARAHDGTIEAIETPDCMVFGVQWHPELLGEAQLRAHLPLFRAIVEAAPTLEVVK